ncbi:MAG: hypothetical protein COT17_04930 [Elusimicrobia bacterium CG08_land_8_20_14_0_20_51_18]|nr:MAG: hypothetical protein COT17_04930 [Elusimicrobia bacterium CG08_land_8_20_14_0_20_51_18]
MENEEKKTEKHAEKQTDIEVNWKFYIKIISVGALLSVLTYFSFSWTMESVIHQRKEVIVPDIKGKSSLKALELLSENNLAMKIQGFEFNDTVPVGTVLRQNPQSGIATREGRMVKVVFSQGGESVFTPNLIGLPLRNGELLLRQRQLLLGERSESYSLKFEKGTILSQDPKAETGVAKNTMVGVMVSAGAPPQGIVLMPDFRQKKIDEFYKWANDNDLKSSTIEDKNSIFPANTIIDQYPDSDSVVTKDAEITVTVSAKPETAQTAANEFQIKYQISQSGSQRHIRIVAVSKTGDRELFNALRDPGSKVELSIPSGSAEKIRIFVNGILVEERPVK